MNLGPRIEDEIRVYEESFIVIWQSQRCNHQSHMRLFPALQDPVVNQAALAGDAAVQQLRRDRSSLFPNLSQKQRCYWEQEEEGGRSEQIHR